MGKGIYDALMNRLELSEGYKQQLCVRLEQNKIRKKRFAQWRPAVAMCIIILISGLAYLGFRAIPIEEKCDFPEAWFYIDGLAYEEILPRQHKNYSLPKKIDSSCVGEKIGMISKENMPSLLEDFDKFDGYEIYRYSKVGNASILIADSADGYVFFRFTGFYDGESKRWREGAKAQEYAEVYQLTKESLDSILIRRTDTGEEKLIDDRKTMELFWDCYMGLMDAIGVEDYVKKVSEPLKEEYARQNGTWDGADEAVHKGECLLTIRNADGTFFRLYYYPQTAYLVLQNWDSCFLLDEEFQSLLRDDFCFFPEDDGKARGSEKSGGGRIWCFLFPLILCCWPVAIGRKGRGWHYRTLLFEVKKTEGDENERGRMKMILLPWRTRKR